MANAVFNEAGDDGLDKLEPEADALFVSVSVREQIGKPNAKQEDYGLVELSGVGTMHSGLAAERISWRVEGFVASNADYVAWENKMRAYIATAARYTLKGKRTQSWQKTALVDFREISPAEDCVGGDVWCGFELLFEWKQPAAEVATA